MEEVKNEQTVNEPVQEKQSEQSEKGAETVSVGKFKDADALLKAYNSLQSEFTKRCQRVKELESAFAEKNAPGINTAEKDAQGITEKEKEEILKGYLQSVLDAKSKAIVMDGAGTISKTPTSKPKTLADAGEYAKKYFNEK